MLPFPTQVYDEVNRFKAALHAYFKSQDRDVLFLEMATGMDDQRRHACIDCIPMDREEGADAPLFFRKAILDSEEWTTNKQLIDTTGKGLRRCVPKGFAYFHVSWQVRGYRLGGCDVSLRLCARCVAGVPAGLQC